MNYFKDREFACRNGVPYPTRWRKTRLRVLRSVLNRIRAEWGAPIKLVSGYRSPVYNRKVGGVRRSQHVQGRAADLVPSGGSPSRLHMLILDMYRDGKLPALKGLGHYPDRFVHIDIRPSKRLMRWRG